MSILKIARMGHPILRQKAAAIPAGEILSPDVQRLIDDMLDTMREYQGVGLAGPQVHTGRQVIVLESPREDGGRPSAMALVNPRISQASRRTEEDWEGCLSIPDMRGLVPRSIEIGVTALGRDGSQIVLTAKGFLARVIQHEVDHLHGILFPDRMTEFASLTFLDEYVRYWAKTERR